MRLCDTVIGGKKKKEIDSTGSTGSIGSTGNTDNTGNTGNTGAKQARGDFAGEGIAGGASLKVW